MKELKVVDPETGEVFELELEGSRVVSMKEVTDCSLK